MINSTNMYSIKHYASTANKTVAFATAYVINTCQQYPDLYTFVLKNADDKAVEMIINIMYLVVLFAVLRSMMRTCMDPFGLKVNAKILELENKLTEEEELYTLLYGEKCDEEEKVAEITKKLDAAEKALLDIKVQYLCCRNAAQLFLDATAESVTQS